MKEKFFVASCVFTEEYPELSRKVQKYISEKNLKIVCQKITATNGAVLNITEKFLQIVRWFQFAIILRRMNFEIMELEENFGQTKFCGYSLYHSNRKSYGVLPLLRAWLETRRKNCISFGTTFI